MTEVKHTNLPWRVEEGTDLIWGACNDEDQSNYGMGYPIASGFSSFGTWAKGRPEFPEKEANAAFIVCACNSHHDLLEALRDLVSACTRYDEQDEHSALLAANYCAAKDKAIAAIAKASDAA